MANTPFLDLVKPAGTDKALVSVINSNSDKIDTGVSTLSDQIGAYDFGTLSYTNFISALDTFCSNLANNAVRRVRVYINSGASSPFGNTIHIGEVYRINTDRYNVVLHQNGSLYDVIGDKDADGWHWDKIATDEQLSTKADFSNLGSQSANTEYSYSVPSSSRNMIMIVSASSKFSTGVIMVGAASGGGVIVSDIMTASGVTVATGTNSLKITTDANSYIYQIVFNGRPMTRVTT
ncbi:MAG: hypothetical protein J6V14_11150 [Clostridia bacterium]|nr:hypothetical protein [Clostridia bacterium]